MINKLLLILYNGKSKKHRISFLFLVFLTANTALGATYYIDSVAGLDSNNGTAITTPWKSVTKVNSKTLVAGDKIYLKCGSVWNGEQLKFSGSGSAASPIIVDQYGTGAKPILNGNGLATTDQGVVYLYNQQYIEINNLEITNYPTLLVYANSTAYTVNQIVYNGIYAYQVTVAGTTPALGGSPTHTSGTAVSGSVTFSYYCNLTNLSYPDNMFFTGISDGTLTNNPLGADRRGVMVALKNKGSGTTAVANHIYLKNLYIHHIKGQLGNGSTTINGAIPKRTGGIYFTVLDETSTSNSRFNDVLIDGCTISYSENVGLAFDNEDNVYYPGGTELALWTARKFTNIKVSNNTIHHIGKNAMIIRCTDETGLIEHNTCYETALGTTGNTMFSARAKGTVFQYNEGYYNRATTQTVDPGTIDGSMYDPDYGSVGIIFQYSYSHDNSEGIYWGCNTRSLSNNTSGIPDPEDVGCTLRYNISQNDKGDLIFLNYSSAGNEIYNNIFYIKSGLSPNIIHENSGNNHTYNFYNNIIYNLGSGGYAFGSGTGIQTRTIQNNTFYGTHASDEPSDIYKLTSNPLFVSPGAGTIGINSLLEGYKLQSGSPALSSGKLIATNGGFDFYGNSVSSSTIPNRGAYQGAAIVSVTPPPTANNQNFCASLNPSVANLVATGTLLKWYANEIGGITIATSTILVTATYYVSQTISGVESSRTAVFVTVNATDSPLASAQLFCNSGTVADLVATGTNLQWYSDATGGSALATTIILSSGTYYASQTLNGCESVRASVAVTKNSTAVPTGSVTTSICGGETYVWPANGQSYTTAQSGTTFISGCNTATLNLTITPNVTPTFTPVADICYGGSASALPTTSNNGITGTWLLASLNNTATTEYTFTPTAGQCATTAKLTITVNTLPDPPAVLCYQTATWNGVTCSYDVTGSQPAEPTTALACWETRSFDAGTCQWNTVGDQPVQPTKLACYESVGTFNTGTCQWNIVGEQPAQPTNLACYESVGTFNTGTCQWNIVGTAPALPQAGNDGTLSVDSTPTNTQLFAALTGADEGGSWTHPAVGFVGVHTYTVTQAAPCSLSDSATVTVSLSTEIPTGPLSFCAGAKVAAAVGNTSLKFYTAQSGTAANLASTVDLTTKTYYVTETINSNESARVPVAITVNALPTVPSKLELTNDAAVLPATSATAIKAVGVYVGANVALKLTATAVGATSYEWTLPAGVTLADGTTTGIVTSTENTIDVKFSASDATSSLIVFVKSVNASGCYSVAKTLTLTRAISTAPANLKMNNGLNLTAITTFAKYMGTDTVLRLTAAASATATSYVWDLPIGVTRVTGLNDLTVITSLETTGTEIFVTLEGVTNANTLTPIATNVLRIGVYGKNGTGLSATVNATLANPATSSTARLLTLTAVKPAAPAILKMYDLAVSATAAVIDVSKYINTQLELKLEAKASALASSYTWYLLEGVNVKNNSADAVPGTLNTYTSTSNAITVNFENVPHEPTAFTLVLGVRAVNGIDGSVSTNAAPNASRTDKLLTVTAAPPAAVATPTGSLKICATTASSVTYTIAAAVKNAVEYYIGVPQGCTITVGTGISDFAIIPAVANASFTVNYPSGFVVTTANPKKILIASTNNIGYAEKFLTLTNTGAICTTRIAPEAAANGFSVKAYPNPSSSTITIETSAKGAINAKVYDMQGRLVENANTTQVGSRLAAGVYNVIVSQGASTKSVRVIKQ